MPVILNIYLHKGWMNMHHIESMTKNSKYKKNQNTVEAREGSFYFRQLCFIILKLTKFGHLVLAF